MKPIEQLRKLFKKNISQIPTFIEGSTSTDKFVWTQLQSVFSTMSKLTTERFLKPETINSLVDNVNISADYIIDVVQDPDVEKQVIHLILVSLDAYIDFSLQHEIYETAHNFTMFKIKWQDGNDVE